MPEEEVGGNEGGVQMQGSRVSIRPQRSGMNGLSDRPHSAASTYSQFGARGGKFSNAKPKSDVEWAIYRAKQCPGPGEYKTNKDHIPRGGRFNMSNPKSDIDWIMKRGSEQPGPSDYRLGDKDGKPTGGKFSTARPKSALEWTIFNARQRPGPGQYDADSNYKVNGGRFSSAKPKSDVEWSMHRAKQQPGPGQYQVRRNMVPSGGKFNMSNPKSDVDWAILKASQSPSPQDYLTDAAYKVVGGRFSQSRPRSALEWEIYRSKQLPGPGEYNSELQSIGRRSGVGYSPSEASLPRTERPRTAHGLPPEARGLVKPKSLNQSSTDSLYGICKDKPKRPSTSSGIPPEARGKTKPQGIPPEARSKLPPRATSAPPGPRTAPSSPKFRPETPTVGEVRQNVNVKMPARPGSVPPKKSNNIYHQPIGEEPTVYRQVESSRPASVTERRPRPKSRTISTQASEEDMRLMERQSEKAQREQKMKVLPRKNSSTGRPMSRDDLGDSDHSKQLYKRPGNIMTNAPMRVSKRIPKKRTEDKHKIVYPMGVTHPAGVTNCRAKLSDNARKLFDLAMQSGEFKKMMELYTGVKDPTDVIEKYAAMWSYQPLFDGRRTR